jgi:hypothetical protein
MKNFDLAIERQRYVQRYISLYRANLRTGTTFHVSGLFELEGILTGLFGVPTQYLSNLREKLSLNFETGSVDCPQDSVKTILL